MDAIADKAALIVGGGSGIGFATAAAMLERGARVWIAGARVTSEAASGAGSHQRNQHPP